MNWKTDRAANAKSHNFFLTYIFFFALFRDNSHLRSHDALAFGDERAFGAHTIAPSAISFVAFEGGNDSVIATTRAFRRPRIGGIGGGA